MLHDKLVRDLIPDRLREQGIGYRVRVLGETEFLAALRNKLDEEVAEFQATTSGDGADLAELADILEVVHALARLGGASPIDLETRRVRKAAERGAFERRLYLIDTDE